MKKERMVEMIGMEKGGKIWVVGGGGVMGRSGGRGGVEGGRVVGLLFRMEWMRMEVVGGGGVGIWVRRKGLGGRG